MRADIMKADIIILSKTWLLLKRALRSIKEHVSKESVGRIVVGWTGKEGECTLDMVGIPGFSSTFKQFSEYNFARCNNVLARECKSKALLFMNDDIELVSDSVSKVLSRLKDKDAGTVGIKLLYRDKTIQHLGQFVSFIGRRFAGVGHICWKKPDFKTSFPTRVIGNTAAFLAIKRQLFFDVGCFDESYKHSLEDV